MVYDQMTSAETPIAPSLIREYLNKVYMWMAASLVVTAVTAVYTARDIELMTWACNHLLLLAISSFAVILVMIFGASRMTSGALAILLMLFAGLEGIWFGPILLLYTQQSLALTFSCTAGMFGAMALYGYFTKRDLSGWGRALMMSLLGLIIAGIANCFWGNGMFDLIISAAGVVVFACLTAYDTQKLVQEGLCAEGEQRSKGAVMGALSLYLDFINLFLYLLRFLGRNND